MNLAPTGLLAQCLPLARSVNLREFKTNVIVSQTSKPYTKYVNGAAVERVVAFPACVSVNDVVCNHPSLASEELVSFSLDFLFLVRFD